MPLIIESDPLVIPRDFRSLEAKPIILPAFESFQNCKISTPTVMNKIQPTIEKKRSGKYLISFTIFKSKSKRFTNSLVDWGVHDVPSKQAHQDDGEAHEGSVNKHNSVLVAMFGHAVVMQTKTC